MALPPGSRLTCAAHRATLHVLNAHAGVISSKSEMGSDVFYAKYAEFIKLLKESDCDDTYLDGVGSSVTRAYWSFLQAHNDEVRRVTGDGSGSRA